MGVKDNRRKDDPRSGFDATPAGGVGKRPRTASLRRQRLVDEAIADGTTALPRDLVERLEQALGTKIDNVRIHASAAAGRAARALGARAYTIGQDVFFGPGHFDPSSSKGQHLIAHEIAHAVQQSSASAPPEGKAEVTRGSDPSEQAADRFAAVFVARGPAAAKEQGAGATVSTRIIARDEDEGGGDVDSSSYADDSASESSAESESEATNDSESETARTETESEQAEASDEGEKEGANQGEPESAEKQEDADKEAADKEAPNDEAPEKATPDKETPEPDAVEAGGEKEADGKEAAGQSKDGETTEETPEVEQEAEKVSGEAEQADSAEANAASDDAKEDDKTSTGDEAKLDQAKYDPNEEFDFDKWKANKEEALKNAESDVERADIERQFRSSLPPPNYDPRGSAESLGSTGEAANNIEERAKGMEGSADHADELRDKGQDPGDYGTMAHNMRGAEADYERAQELANKSPDDPAAQEDLRRATDSMQRTRDAWERIYGHLRGS